MNSTNETQQYSQNLNIEWNEKNDQNKTSDSEETISCETEDGPKIKPEVELKEETGGFIYKADFRGHLQLVNLDSNISNSCRTGDELIVATTYPINFSEETSNKVSNDCSEGIESYPVQAPREKWSVNKENPQVERNWDQECKRENAVHVYQDLKNMAEDGGETRYYIKEEPGENDSQESHYEVSLPEIYDPSSNNNWDHQPENSVQVPTRQIQIPKDKSALLTQAEKKRLYRMRIKEDNPDLWSAIKKKEAARKREQREKRRQVIQEMQKAMELSIGPESPEAENQKLYLEALKERYPEIWSQLEQALPAASMKNRLMCETQESSDRRSFPKPDKVYKDVIEAQKKRLYRQRLKEERPEMYERIKAKEAYARSIQRLFLKKKQSLEEHKFNLESLHPSEIEQKLTYLHNLQIETQQLMSSKQFYSNFFKSMNGESTIPNIIESNLSAPPPVESCYSNQVSNTKSDPSKICDINHQEGFQNSSELVKQSSDDDISNETKEIHKVDTNTPTACTTQSDILWYWNDVTGSRCPEVESPQPSSKRKGPQILNEEERMEKILRERMQLKEKRRRYRMNMTPEKRLEFLEYERERLKQYRLKKKVAEAADELRVSMNQ